MEDHLDTAADCSKVTKKGSSQLHFGDNKGQCKLFSIQSRNNLAVYNNKEWLLSSESLIFVTNKLNAV